MNWRITYSRQAKRDAKKVRAAGFQPKVDAMIRLIAVDPFYTPPAFEKLGGELSGAYSRRINIQHRLVYRVDEDTRDVRVLRMWTHYE